MKNYRATHHHYHIPTSFIIISKKQEKQQTNCNFFVALLSLIVSTISRKKKKPTHTHFWQNVLLEVSPSLMLDKMLKDFHVLIWWNVQMNLVETFPKSFERLVLVKKIPQNICIQYLSFRDILTQRRFALRNFKVVSSFQNCSLPIHFPNFPHVFSICLQKNTLKCSLQDKAYFTKHFRWN